MTLFKRNKLIIRNLNIVYILLCCLTCSKDFEFIQEEYQSGKIEYLKGNLEKSKTHFLSVKKREPDFEDIGLYLAKIEYYQGKFEQSSKSFSDLIDNETYGYQAYLLKLKSDYAYRKDRSQLLIEVGDGLKKDSSNLDLLILAAKLNEELGQISQAILYYGRILNESDKLILAHKELKKIYQKAGLEERVLYHSKKLELWNEGNTKEKKEGNK